MLRKKFNALKYSDDEIIKVKHYIEQLKTMENIARQFNITNALKVVKATQPKCVELLNLHMAFPSNPKDVDIRKRLYSLIEDINENYVNASSEIANQILFIGHQGNRPDNIMIDEYVTYDPNNATK